MKDKKILLVSSEVNPYFSTSKTGIGDLVFDNGRYINKQGTQIRIFMPCFGGINERKHQLHEVIRLSGINLVINDMDMPLIIKVGSIPGERMQVYFIHNDEYFNRKETFADDKGLFPDNDERAIFFIKGVMETVKRLNWSPDIIHIHGWFGLFLPLYLKTYYKKEPLFFDTKIVTSIYPDSFDGVLTENLKEKFQFDNIPDDFISLYERPTYNALVKNAIDYSDGVILAGGEIDEEVNEKIDNSDKPILELQSEEYSFAEKCYDFYKENFLS